MGKFNKENQFLSDDADDIEPVLPNSYQPTDESSRDDTRSGSTESGLSVTIKHNGCKNCGAVVPLKYHDRCKSPIVFLNGDWKCSSCGVQITPTKKCDRCGSATGQRKIEVPLDLTPDAHSEDIEKLAHKQTNERRKNNGLAELQYNHHLSAIALQHSRDMAERDYFSHESPDGNGTSDRYKKFGHDTKSSGENIAKEYSHITQSPMESAEAVVGAWMNSPGHRENILREQFGEEGIGVFLESSGAMYVTQNFY
jgi:uncharacterized protein YkwD